jgi:thiamine-monophosphate kinase
MRENDLLAWIAANAGRHPSVPLGIGDDMAVVNLHAAPGNDGVPALLKIDQALDQVHFDLRTHSPAAAGRKAVNRCLSDCAAMACSPAAILVSVALPRNADLKLAQELFIGCRDAAAVFDCPLVGGDTAVWDQRLVITVAAIGVASGRPILRNAAQPGDSVCVSGKLGGSIIGRHMNFIPRINMARQLASMVDLHAMMDLSDGLAMDLPRLLKASGCGAAINSETIPIHDDAETLSSRDGKPALWHALCDGEDYELLFTLSGPDAAQLGSLSLEAPISVIGTITKEPQLILQDAARAKNSWPKGGWEHGSMEVQGHE